jgi:hypothetical protein
MSAHDTAPITERPVRWIVIAAIAACAFVANPGHAEEAKAPDDRTAASAKDEDERGDAWLQVDLWYTSRSSGVGRTRRRLSLAGPQGDPIPFGFAPVRHATMTARPSPANFVEIEIEVAGNVSGTLRADGAIDVDLDLRRTLRARIPGGASPAPTTEGGSQKLKVRPGESVEVILPPIQRPPLLGVDQLGDLVDVFTGSRETVVLTVEVQAKAGQN